MKSKFVSIGLVSNVVGLKGQVKVTLQDNVFVNDITSLKLLFYCKNEVFFPLQVETMELRKNHLLLKFKKLDNLEATQKLKGTKVFVSIDDHSFSFQCSWKDYQANIDSRHYPIVDFMHNGVYDLVRIEMNHHQFWIPVVEKYVQNQDKEAKILYLQNIEGLV